jgi:hypothetical protein
MRELAEQSQKNQRYQWGEFSTRLEWGADPGPGQAALNGVGLRTPEGAR